MPASAANRSWAGSPQGSKSTQSEDLRKLTVDMREHKHGAAGRSLEWARRNPRPDDARSVLLSPGLAQKELCEFPRRDSAAQRHVRLDWALRERWPQPIKRFANRVTATLVLLVADHSEERP